MRHILVRVAIGLSTSLGIFLAAERPLILDVEAVQSSKLASPFHSAISHNASVTKTVMGHNSVVAGELYLTEKRAGIIGDSADLMAQLAGLLERPPAWTVLENIDDDLHVNPVVLEVAARRGDGHMVEPLSPINARVRTVREIKPKSRADAGECNGVWRDVLGVPGSAHVDEGSKLHDVVSFFRRPEGEPWLDGIQEGVVTNERVLPIAAHTVSSADRELLQRKQVIVGKLEVDPIHELDSC